MTTSSTDTGAAGLRAAPAEPPAVPLVLTLGRDDAGAVLEGRLRLDTAYMQGRVKLAGDQRAVLELLAASASPAWEVARSRVEAFTLLDGPVGAA